MSLTKQQLELAEARCLELVNNQIVHAAYNAIFTPALAKHGAAALYKVAVDAREGNWTELPALDNSLHSLCTNLRSRYSFNRGPSGSRPSCLTNTHARVVFGLVLLHWLSSNAPYEDQVKHANDYAKKVTADVDKFVSTNNALIQSNPCSEIVLPPIKKENTMSLKIETRTFVNGADIAKLSVEELVSLISAAEAEITKLTSLGSKPKKVRAKIEELEAGLAKLVELADAE